MKLTYEIKDYISKRLDALVPNPVELFEFQKVEKEVKAQLGTLVDDLNNKLNELNVEIVKKYPELNGCKLYTRYDRNDLIIFDAADCKLKKKAKAANELRKNHLETLEALAQIDTANCKSSEELDDILIRLSKR